MKAAVLHELKKPMAVEEVDRPIPGEGEVLIKVEACGVCHSDLHVADGDWKQFAGITKLPLIVGHEVAGKVVEVGPRRARTESRRPRRRALDFLDLRRVRILPRRQ